MRFPLVLSALLLAAASARAETKYLVMEMNGKRVGYTSSDQRSDTYEGKPALRSQSRTTLFQNFGGTTVKTVMEAVVWTTPDNRPLRKTLTAAAAGAKSRIEAVYGPKSVEIDVDANGEKSHKSIPLPDGPVFEDEARVVHDHLTPGETFVFWSKDMDDSPFDRIEMRCVGPSEVVVDGQKVPALLTEERSGNVSVKLYTSAAGDLLRAEYPTGTVLRAASKAVALAAPDKPSDDTDILRLLSLKVEGLPENVENLRELKLRVVGADLSKIPSDETQTVTKDGDGWVVDIHPPLPQLTFQAPIAGIAKGQEAWTQPTPHLDAGAPKIKVLAQKILDGAGGRFWDATRAIRMEVGERMKYKIEMGPLRDASDILRRPTGKCTEYAVLTTALLRAAGIPARLATGLVPGDDGALYYHAWTEAWDGTRWVGVDSTTDDDLLSAYYLKLADGNADDLVRGSAPLDPQKVKITVLSLVRWSR